METKLYKLMENNKKHIVTFTERCDIANEAFMMASANLKEAREILWEELAKMWPECKDKRSSFNNKTFEITYTEISNEDGRTTT